MSRQYKKKDIFFNGIGVFGECLSLMSLTELAPLNCSARKIEGRNPNKLAITAGDAALNILLPF